MKEIYIRYGIRTFFVAYLAIGLAIRIYYSFGSIALALEHALGVTR